jgi:NAD(P)-dependent dehydrogenase (short-subunit alcohol dehydrogenase family)
LQLIISIEAYGYSKLGNVISAKVLAKQLKEEGNNPLVFSLHPGVVATDIWRKMPSALSYVIKKFMVCHTSHKLHFVTSHMSNVKGRDVRSVV